MLGVSSVVPFRVHELDDPPRLVVDLGPGATSAPAGPAGTADARATAPCDSLGQSSSPSAFDATSGTYAATIQDVTGGTIRFDVIQWLRGPDAKEAYRQDEPGTDEGPPGDYWTRNGSDEQRTATVDDAAQVELVRLSEDADPATGPGTVAELERDVADQAMSVYWLTFENGAITRVCEQYLP